MQPCPFYLVRKHLLWHFVPTKQAWCTCQRLLQCTGWSRFQRLKRFLCALWFLVRAGHIEGSPRTAILRRYRKSRCIYMVAMACHEALVQEAPMATSGHLGSMIKKIFHGGVPSTLSCICGAAGFRCGSRPSASHWLGRCLCPEVLPHLFLLTTCGLGSPRHSMPGTQEI